MSDDSMIDYRFILANERTFLAWIRTSLGIIAGGVALDQFVVVEGGEGLIVGLAIAAILLGSVVAVMGTVRWSRADRAMREQRAMHRSRGILVVGVSVAVIAVIIAVILVLQ